MVFFSIWIANTHPLHIIIVEVATTMRRSSLIQLRKIFHPPVGCISAHCCHSIISPCQNEHFWQFNGTSKPEKETACWQHHWLLTGKYIINSLLTIDQIVKSGDLDENMIITRINDKEGKSKISWATGGGSSGGWGGQQCLWVGCWGWTTSGPPWTTFDLRLDHFWSRLDHFWSKLRWFLFGLK